MAKYALLRAALKADGFDDLHPAVRVGGRDRISAFAGVRARFYGGYARRFRGPAHRISWSPELVRRTLASSGGTLAAARDALTLGIAGNLAGGTHHAFRDVGEGFCVLNDLAIAIQTLRREGRIQRAAVIDLDVHQGDGTAAIFQGDCDILTLSIHGEHNFPFRKQRSSIDIGLHDGAGDEEFLKALGDSLPAVEEFRPDLILYQSGVDALREDRLGRLRMTLDGLKQRDHFVFERTNRAKLPVAITLGGGYSEPVEMTVAAHANTFRIGEAVYSSVATEVLLTAS